MDEEEKTRFWCSARHEEEYLGSHPADVLVKSAGVRNPIYPTCYEALTQTVRDRLAEDQRAAIQVRDARTWHEPRG